MLSFKKFIKKYETVKIDLIKKNTNQNKKKLIKQQIKSYFNAAASIRSNTTF